MAVERKKQSWYAGMLTSSDKKSIKWIDATQVETKEKYDVS